MRESTFWNGEPCEARRVRVIVGKPPRPSWWFAGLEGTEREAVEIEYGGETFYIDNDATPDDYQGRVCHGGEGWDKVTAGRGSPQWGHRSLVIERVVGDSVQLELDRITGKIKPLPKREDYPSRQAYRRAVQKHNSPHGG